MNRMHHEIAWAASLDLARTITAVLDAAPAGEDTSAKRHEACYRAFTAALERYDAERAKQAKRLDPTGAKEVKA